jgi:hypothetical protein
MAPVVIEVAIAASLVVVALTVVAVTMVIAVASKTLAR